MKFIDHPLHQSTSTSLKREVLNQVLCNGKINFRITLTDRVISVNIAISDRVIVKE
jgi:hypothetical protein